MPPQPDERQNRTPEPHPEAADGDEQATRYGATPPADAATNYRAAPPAPADMGATCSADQAADPGRSNYQAAPPSDDTNATRYAAGPADPEATGYTPTDAKTRVPSDRRLPRRFGGYELLEEIGHGGMGLVFKAQQLEPERLVALKMIRAGELASEADVRRFRQEAAEAARLDHPNIVPVYEVGEHEGRHFFTMKLVEGGSLAQHLERFRNDPRAAARVLVVVAEAVHHAHQRQLLHRDLKPGNVLLDGRGQPHVADFGLAKRMGGLGEASQSAGAGTPEYMAPEQARGGGRLTTAADVYGLGGILYALLASRPPFQGASAWDIIQQVLSREPVAPSKHQPGCPRDLETICLKCLEKEPAQRYGSAEALAEDLWRFLEHRPVRARPVGSFGRAARWSRRNPLAGTSLAALVAVFLLAFVAVLGLWRNSEANRRLADTSRAEAQEQRDRAEENFQEARLAVKQLTQVSVNRLQQAPAGLQPLRKELLETALGYYQRLLARRSDDPQLRAEIAEDYFLLGNASAALGSRAEAAAAYRKAVDLYRQLARENPQDPNAPNRLAECYQALGSVCQSIGRSEEASESCAAAVRLLQGLADAHPDVPAYQAALVRGYHSLGDLHRAGGEAGRAEEDYHHAEALLGRLLEEDGADPDYRTELANNYNHRARLQADARRWEKAEAAYRAALDVWNKLASEFPGDSFYALGEAGAHNDLGYLDRARGLPREALDENKQALAASEKMAEKNEADPSVRATRANSLLGVGSSYALLKDSAQAEDFLGKALAIWLQLTREYPEEVWYSDSLGETYVQLGGIWSARRGHPDAERVFGEAIRTLEAVRLRDQGDNDTNDWLRQAYEGRGRVYAQTDRPEKAVADLREALQLSRGRARNDLLESLRQDPELNPLRGRGDFQPLLQEGR
jgi:tetratricopeptide (TPR) repeat protein